MQNWQKIRKPKSREVANEEGAYASVKNSAKGKKEKIQEEATQNRQLTSILKRGIDLEEVNEGRKKSATLKVCSVRSLTKSETEKIVLYWGGQRRS